MFHLTNWVHTHSLTHSHSHTTTLSPINTHTTTHTKTQLNKQFSKGRQKNKEGEEALGNREGTTLEDCCRSRPKQQKDQGDLHWFSVPCQGLGVLLLLQEFAVMTTVSAPVSVKAK